MKSSPKPVAFITGASSGIGAETARDLAKRGYAVVLLARRTDRLQTLRAEIEAAGGEALALSGDVTDAPSLEKAVKDTRARFGRIDVVLANAGFGVAGPLHKLTVEDYRRQFETNVFGVLNTVYATRESLVESKGILAMVASVAGHVAVPYMTAYSMSKFAVRALGLGLRAEMKKKGVAVVVISPGYIATEIAQVGNDGKLTTQGEQSKQMPGGLVVSVERAAPAIVRGILSRKAEVVITGHGKVFVLLNRLFPGLVRFIGAKMQGA